MRSSVKEVARVLVTGKGPSVLSNASLESLADRTGVLDLLGSRKELAGTFPRARQVFLAQAAMGMGRLGFFREVVAALAESYIDVMPIKGMAYALMFERGGPVRHMADIDILVRQNDFERAAGVLAALGYEEVFSGVRVGTRLHNERQFVKNDQLVELHRAFLPPGRVDIDYDGIWERSLPLEQDGVRCRRLDREDTFLYHCFHFAMHEFAIGGLRAVWEMRRLVLEDGPELAACLARARRWGTVRATWCSLRLLEVCFPGPAPRTIDGSTGSGRERLDGQVFEPGGWRREFGKMIPLPVRLALERLVVQPSLEKLLHPGFLPRPVQLLRKALLVDSLANALAYLAWYGRAMVSTGRR